MIRTVPLVTPRWSVASDDLYKHHACSIIHGADVSHCLLNKARRRATTGHIRWDHIAPGACAMTRYLKAAQSELKDYRAQVIAGRGRGEYWLSRVRGLEPMLPTLGALPPAEARQCMNHMLKSHENRTFFVAGTFYTFHAERR